MRVVAALDQPGPPWQTRLDMRIWPLIALFMTACGGYPEPVKNGRPAGWGSHEPQVADDDTEGRPLPGTCEQLANLCLDAQANGACPHKRATYSTLACIDANKTCCDAEADSVCAGDAPSCEVCGMTTMALCSDFGWECPQPPSTCL